ncbi:hypothetical protein DE146DRAFT_765295 [Phaeosphaeria sp. MPI-PUGE-AT-0046c]|nr:hypothetical protein DE146DRAFT_765295 [Phaeosphaeria sp. MPI-PUGE-AT-0046c]
MNNWALASANIAEALAAFAYRLDGKELSDRGHKIQEAILLCPTLFPLAFAALGGRSLKRIALWRAQEGTSLGFLEHVIGSQSLVAAIGHAITLHSLNLLTLVMLAFWALSPLGGQSALRLVHETNSTISETRSVFYANVDAPSQFPAQAFSEDALNRVNGVVATALLTADTLETSPIDTWSHPKIPRLDVLEEAESNNDTIREWYDVDRQKQYSYASLTGVGVINLSEDGATNFTLPYEYMYFNCELSTHNNITSSEHVPGVVNTAPNALTQMKWLNELNNANNLESGGLFPRNATLTNVFSSYREFFMYIRGTAIKPEALIYGSKEIGLNYFIFECSMKSVMVEANVICEADSCYVQRLRRLNKARQDRMANATGFPWDVVNNGYTNKFLIKHLAMVGGNQTQPVSAPNPVDTYLNGERPWARNELGVFPTHNWTQLIKNPQSITALSHRMTRFMNTFWDSSRWPLATTRNDPFARVSLDESGTPPVGMIMNATRAIVTWQIPIYRANVGWVACLVICSSVLLLLGIISAFLSLRIVVPDIFDYVSSFTRDNPYVKAPHGGSGLNGAERARLLRKLPVQLGDVKPNADVGYLSVRSVQGSEDCKYGRARSERMYR